MGDVEGGDNPHVPASCAQPNPDLFNPPTFDLEDYEIDMLSGAFLGCIGCYHLWKMAPSTFVDVALAFLFYKLSIVSSELHQHRKSNSLTTRLKFGTILVMVLKDIKKSYVLLDAVRCKNVSVEEMEERVFGFEVTEEQTYLSELDLGSYNKRRKSRGGARRRSSSFSDQDMISCRAVSHK